LPFLNEKVYKTGGAKMENLLDLLNFLEYKLEEEKELLIKSISDTKYSAQLDLVVQEKKDIISKLASFNKEDFEPFKEKLENIQRLSNRNMEIALGNAKFIEEIFDSIFADTPQQYNQSGTVQSEKKGLINKKI
jgi:hypothetical protein